jgi:hypothetical protein
LFSPLTILWEILWDAAFCEFFFAQNAPLLQKKVFFSKKKKGLGLNSGPSLFEQEQTMWRFVFGS